MSANVYYSPERFGLRTVGEIDFSSGSYEFDILVVFQDVETGRIFYAEDSGCSCPCPFEIDSRETLTPVASADDLRSRLDFRRDEAYGNYVSSEDVQRLVGKVREALA